MLYRCTYIRPNRRNVISDTASRSTSGSEFHNIEPATAKHVLRTVDAVRYDLSFDENMCNFHKGHFHTSIAYRNVQHFSSFSSISIDVLKTIKT